MIGRDIRPIRTKTIEDSREMKFGIFALSTVPGTLAERERLRPIGRNNERVQQMFEELRAIAIRADQS